MPNRLSGETSPYLQQHAANPVDWYPWGEEALSRARSEDRPILLSVGYSACHWCHVMAHESFEDPEVAAVMNRLFVNVKVDREERPDLDQIYQTAHQMLARRAGGWPLTMFLSPDGTPFFGGTYFPRTPRYGMPAFPELCERIAAIWREQRAEIEAQNREVLDALARSVPAGGASRSEFSAEVLGATGDVVQVTGRGALTAVPDTVSIDGRAPQAVTAWAGPWPLEERWWDPERQRRMARFQLTTEHGAALLAVVENQQWWITAIY